MTKIPSDSLTPNNFRSTAHQMSALTTGPWLHPFIEAAAVQINNTNLPPGNTSTCIMNDAINQWRSYVYRRARCSNGSSVESLMVDSLSYFSFQPVLHIWCIKGCVMCYPVCGMVHIKKSLKLMEKSTPCDGSGFQKE